ETPLHAGHLRLMHELALTGAVILPPAPGFYHLPKTVDDIVAHRVGKALDQRGVEHALFKRWAGVPRSECAWPHRRDPRWRSSWRGGCCLSRASSACRVRGAFVTAYV